MKKVTQVIMLITLTLTILSATTLSASEAVTSINQAEAVLDQVSSGETAGFTDAIDIGTGIEVAKDIVNGDGFDWSRLINFLLPALFFGCGWWNSRSKSKTKDKIFSTIYEGAEATGHVLTYIAKPTKKNLDIAIKEARDCVLVPKKLK